MLDACLEICITMHSFTKFNKIFYFQNIVRMTIYFAEKNIHDLWLRKGLVKNLTKYQKEDKKGLKVVKKLHVIDGRPLVLSGDAV